MGHTTYLGCGVDTAVGVFKLIVISEAVLCTPFLINEVIPISEKSADRHVCCKRGGVLGAESLWFGNYGKLVRGSVRRLIPPHSGASIPSRIPEG